MDLKVETELITRDNLDDSSLTSSFASRNFDVVEDNIQDIQSPKNKVNLH